MKENLSKKEIPLLRQRIPWFTERERVSPLDSQSAAAIDERRSDEESGSRDQDKGKQLGGCFDGRSSPVVRFIERERVCVCFTPVFLQKNR